MPKMIMMRFSAIIINVLTRSANERGVFRVMSVFSRFYNKDVIIADTRLTTIQAKLKRRYYPKSKQIYNRTVVAEQEKNTVLI